MVFHFRLGWGRIDGAHVSFIYLNVNVYMFWFLNICQCVSECPVKCEDSRSRHSHLAAFTDRSHSPTWVFHSPGGHRAAKSNRLHSQPWWTHISTCKYAKGQLFHNVFHFYISVFISTHCLLLTMSVKVGGTFTVVHFWLLVFLSHRVAFHVLPLQVPPPPLAGKHNDEQKCGGRDDGNRNIGCTLKTKTLVRLKKKTSYTALSDLPLQWAHD